MCRNALTGICALKVFRDEPPFIQDIYIRRNALTGICALKDDATNRTYTDGEGNQVVMPWRAFVL